MSGWYRIKAQGATLYFRLPDLADDQRPAKFREKTVKQIAREALGSDVRVLEMSEEGKPEKLIYSGRSVYGVALMMEGRL